MRVSGVLVLMAVACAACSGGGEEVTPQASTSPPGLESSTEQSLQRWLADGDQLVEPPYPALATGGYTAPLDRVVVGAGGTELTLHFTGSVATGPCSSAYTAGVAESATAVAVLVAGVPVVADPVPSGVQACPAIAQFREVTVTLSAPLGDRTVVDGVRGVAVAPS